MNLTYVHVICLSSECKKNVRAHSSAKREVEEKRFCSAENSNTHFLVSIEILQTYSYSLVAPFFRIHVAFKSRVKRTPSHTSHQIGLVLGFLLDSYLEFNMAS